MAHNALQISRFNVIYAIVVLGLEHLPIDAYTGNSWRCVAGARSALPIQVGLSQQAEEVG